LYWAGKKEEAILQLQEATKQRGLAYYPPDQKVYGNAFDMLFIAMAQYAPEKADQARRTLESTLQDDQERRIHPAVRKPGPESHRVWNRLEFAVLRREAEDMIKP
jgi:hypothetical protein